MGTSTACSPGSARHRHISTPALPTRSVFVWAGGEGRLPGARLSGWQSAHAGSMGAPCRGRHRMREHSLPACSVGLVGREVGNWKGPELTPLCATTEAGQLRSPPCFAGGGGFSWHGKGFSPLVSFCNAQEKWLLHGCTKAQKDPPWGGTWARRWWVHVPCKIASLRARVSLTLMATGQHLGDNPEACGSALEEDAPEPLSLLSSVLGVGPALQEHNFRCKPIPKLFTKSSALKLRALPGKKCNEGHQGDGNRADISTHMPNYR